MKERPIQGIKKLTAVAAHTAMMKVAVHREYGEPEEVLTVGEVGMPMPGDGDLLIRVVVAGVSIGDHHIVTGKPYLVRLSPFGGFPRPLHAVPGAAMSGCVSAVGAKVTGFHVGDEVFGQALSGAFAEFVVMPANLVAHKPKNLSFEEAAAVPWGTTALQGLRDAGEVKPGERVLLNGASGAVGTWAVQIAKSLGAHVTAVCATRNVELVRSLGADAVIDYTKNDFVEGGARFDVLMDMVGNRTLSDCKRVLNAGGRYVPCSAGGGDWLGPIVRIIGGQFTFLFGGKRLKMFMQKVNAVDLVVMRDLIEAGAIRPVIERIWPLAETNTALHHVGTGHARGLTVVRISEPRPAPLLEALQ
jgi:NADPH:quinone reductase-like Zn-dependent oxidoreductase